MERGVEVEEMKNREEEELGVRRIFVGGLGGSVSGGDLEKTFSSLGTVKGIDIVRTNGRSFAYMDFQPSSLKSLSKLFSTYNGCTWKGGRLRLENAKEHYLVRLRREWKEDADPAQKSSDELYGDDKKETAEQAELLPPEKVQLRMFFPRLRKVKSFPYSGTGKHKYSFQRIEVPLLPIHFCDCEEHCIDPEGVKEKPVSAYEDQIGLVKEEELNMMRSVMNNILKRDVNSTIENSKNIVTTEGENPKVLTDDIPFSGNDVDQEGDEDDLVINIVSVGNSKNSRRMGKIYQELGKQKPSTVVPSQNKIKAQKGKDIDSFNSSDTTAKKTHFTSLVSNGDEFVPCNSKKREHLETCPEESKGAIEAQVTEGKKSISRSSAGSFWRQNSSWRELVGKNTSSSFSISQILKDTDKNQEVQEANGLDTPSPSNIVEQKVAEPVSGKYDGDCSNPLKVAHNVSLQEDIVPDASPKVPSGTPTKESEIPNEALVSLSRTPFQESERLKGALTNVSGIPSKESKNPKEAQALNVKGNIHQTAGGQSWTQKWRELVRETESSPFSISQVLPGVATKKQKLNSNSLDTAKAIDNKQQSSTMLSRSRFDANGSKNYGVKNGEVLPVQGKVTAPVGSSLTSRANESVFAGLGDGSTVVEEYPKDEQKGKDTPNSKSSESKISQSTLQKKISLSDKKTGIEADYGESYSFMRSNASEKEWMKLRATLSGSIKKKSNEK